MDVFNNPSRFVNVYSAVNCFMALACISVLCACFSLGNIPLWAVIAAACLNLSYTGWVRKAAYLAPMLASMTSGGIVPALAVLAACIPAEASAKSGMQAVAGMKIHDGIFNSPKVFIRKGFDFLCSIPVINRGVVQMNPDVVSAAGVACSAAGLGVSLLFRDGRITVPFFLLSFLLDFLDGYTAMRIEEEGRPRGKSFLSDGICDRTVEILLVLYNFLFFSSPVCLCLLGFAWILNVLYQLRINKICVTLIRPMVVLAAAYGLGASWPFLSLLFFPLAFRLITGYGLR